MHSNTDYINNVYDSHHGTKIYVIYVCWYIDSVFLCIFVRHMGMTHCSQTQVGLAKDWRARLREDLSDTWDQD